MINTVYELITDVMAKQYPDRVAFRYVAADGKTVVEKTYAQYVQDIRRAVTYFKENIPDIKGKRVGIMSRNCYEYGVNSFGAILAGAVVVTINQKKTWPELEYELGLVEPSLIVNDGIDYGCRPNIEAAYGDKLRPMDAFKDSAPAELVDCVGHDDLMVLMFTSGSSGEPKGVPLTHHNLLSNISQCSSRITLEPQSRFLGSLPVFHCFGITIGLWYPMIGGYDMVTYPSPLEAKRLGALIKQYGISLVVTTPTFLRGFMKRCEPDTFKTVRYLIVGAEKLPEDLSAAFREKFGIIPCEGYGLTEASPVCSVNFIDPAPSNAAGDFIPGMKKSSVGALLPGIAIRITSPHTGRVVPITTSGMIWLKGPNIFPGYLGGPETDRDIFVDGWLKTGDIGSADEFGFLKIEGRISRFSKIGGEMVPHEALEAAIMNIWNLDPADEERRIAVVTIPDPVKGEAVALLTTLVTDYVHQARTLIRHGLIDQGLPALWCPKEIIPVERIPVLPSGKLDIKQCRMLAYEALNIPFEP